MWDHVVSKEHPEWLCKSEDGSIVPPKASPIGFYTNFCLNSPYRQYLFDLTEDIFETFGKEIDGLFYDIVWDTECYCDTCKQIMKERGYHVDDKKDARKYQFEKVNDFINEMSHYIRSRDDSISIYYNNGCVRQGNRGSLAGFTHLEFDALPSGNPEGYNTMLLRSRFDRTLGLDYIGQTGKFHTAWADFHTFKSQEALEYECFKLLSYGAKCLIGDQMLPSGKLCEHTYNLIGKVYKQIEEKEPWCDGVQPVVDIGLFTPNEFEAPGGIGIAAAKILEEAGHQFDILDSYSDFGQYKLIILADQVVINDKLGKKLNRYVDNGGKIIATFESGLDPLKQDFVFDKLGVRLNEKQTKDEEGNLVRGQFYWRNHYGDYVIPKGEMAVGLHDTEYMMYSKAIEVSAIHDEDIVYNIIEPYFYRTQEHFCAHRQAPSSGQESSVAVLKNNHCIYMAHPMFAIYKEYAPPWVKQMILNAVDILLKDPILRHDGPPTLQTTVNDQNEYNRFVLHLLHYIPQRKARAIEVVDCKIPLYNIPISMRMDKKSKGYPICTRK